MARQTQEDRVYNYLSTFGSITTYEAFRELGVTRLAAKVFELRKKGVPISNVREYGTNRFGDPVHWDRYFLKKGAGDESSRENRVLLS